MRNFLAGLTVGILVTVFSQLWYLYNKNEEALAAVFERRSEIALNKAHLAEAKEQIAKLGDPSSTRLLGRPIAADISFKAYERNLSRLAIARKQFSQPITSYYLALTRVARAEANALAGLTAMKEIIGKTEARINFHINRRDFLLVNQDKLQGYSDQIQPSLEMIRVLENTHLEYERLQRDLWKSQRAILAIRIKMALGSGSVAESALDAIVA